MHHIWNSIANIIVVDGGICIHIRYDMSLFRKGCDVYTVAVCHSLHMIIPAHQILTDIQFSLAHGTPEHNTISQKFSHMVCGRRNGNNNMLVIMLVGKTIQFQLYNSQVFQCKLQAFGVYTQLLVVSKRQTINFRMQLNVFVLHEPLHLQYWYCRRPVTPYSTRIQYRHILRN